MSDLFNTIGEKAEKVAPTGVPDGAVPDGEEERAVEEIESLCMNCGENVSRRVSTRVLVSVCRLPADRVLPLL